MKKHLLDKTWVTSVLVRANQMDGRGQIPSYSLSKKNNTSLLYTELSNGTKQQYISFAKFGWTLSGIPNNIHSPKGTHTDLDDEEQREGEGENNQDAGENEEHNTAAPSCTPCCCLLLHLINVCIICR